jgi:HSP20 family protein
MFALMPWKKERMPAAVARRMETPFRLMAREFEPFFHRLFGEWPLLEPETWGLPPWGFETEEREKEYLIRAELPGFEAAELEVKLTGNELIIVAEHKEPEGKKEEKAERHYAKVERSVTLPPDVIPEKLEALYRNGVLEMHVPKAPEAAGRRIEVKT